MNETNKVSSHRDMQR